VSTKTKKGKRKAKQGFVVAFGNPFDGIVLHGPFVTQDDAIAYGEVHRADHEEWFAIPVNPPEE